MAGGRPGQGLQPEGGTAGPCSSCHFCENEHVFTLSTTVVLHRPTCFTPPPWPCTHPFTMCRVNTCLAPLASFPCLYFNQQVAHSVHLTPLQPWTSSPFFSKNITSPPASPPRFTLPPTGGATGAYDPFAASDLVPILPGASGPSAAAPGALPTPGPAPGYPPAATAAYPPPGAYPPAGAAPGTFPGAPGPAPAPGSYPGAPPVGPGPAPYPSAPAHGPGPCPSAPSAPAPGGAPPGGYYGLPAYPPTQGYAAPPAPPSAQYGAPQYGAPPQQYTPPQQYGPPAQYPPADSFTTLTAPKGSNPFQTGELVQSLTYTI